MTVKLILRAVSIALVGIGTCWFLVASDYSDAAVSGTYKLVYNGMESTLVLHPDHCFRQEVGGTGGIQKADGTWRRVGEGGVAFSREFLTLPGEQRAKTAQRTPTCNGNLAFWFASHSEPT